MNEQTLRGDDCATSEDDQTLFQESVRRFLQQEVAPHYEQWEADHKLPRALRHRLGEAGLLGVDLPEQLGGFAAGVETCLMICEEISRQGFGGLASGYNIHANIVMPYIHHLGNPAQQACWLPRMAAGEVLGAIAMTEPGAGSDLAAMRASAQKVPGGWKLNGSKVFITNGLLADMVIVCAKTDPSARARGVSLFLVDTALPGFSRGKAIRKIGQHASDTAELFFDDLIVPEDALLGEAGKGFAYLMQELPRERLGVAAQAIGAIEGALHLTLDYVQQRRAFGQRIADFQNTRFALADVRAQLEMGRAYFEKMPAALCPWRNEQHRRSSPQVDAERDAVPLHRPMPAAVWRLRLHPRISNLPLLCGCAHPDHLCGHFRNHERSDRPRHAWACGLSDRQEGTAHERYRCSAGRGDPLRRPNRHRRFWRKPVRL